MPVRGRHLPTRSSLDHDRTAAEHARERLLRRRHQGPVRLRGLLRPACAARCAKGPRDTWVGDSPDRAELEELLGHDPELIDVLFETSIADVVDALHERRAAAAPALYGQGVIGAWAGPRDPGTASIKLMHFAGELEGVADGVGLRRGRHGRASRSPSPKPRGEAGAVLAAGRARRPRSARARACVLEGGELIRARAVVSNADPQGHARPARRRRRRPTFAGRVDGWRMTSPVMKVNCGLDRLPRWTAVPDDGLAVPARRCRSPAASTTPRQAFEALHPRRCRRPGFAELYFQTALRPDASRRRASTR